MENNELSKYKRNINICLSINIIVILIGIFLMFCYVKDFGDTSLVNLAFLHTGYASIYASIPLVISIIVLIINYLKLRNLETVKNLNKSITYYLFLFIIGIMILSIIVIFIFSIINTLYMLLFILYLIGFIPFLIIGFYLFFNNLRRIKLLLNDKTA